jgi:hypothetical protein
MLTQHIAIVPEAAGIDFAELTRVSAALQKQVTRDLAPLWNVTGTVDAFHALEDVPIGYWPIVLTSAELGRNAGVHLDRNGQPYAHISLSPFWSLDASRACLEMLINPFGDRTTTGPSPREDQGMVEYLVEVAGPCASRIHGYAVHGVFVSDFCTPAFFSPGTNGAARGPMSFNGSVRRPFQLLQGGYLTWHDAVSNSWWSRSMPGHVAVDFKLGTLVHPQMSARALAQQRGPARAEMEAAPAEAFGANLKRVQHQATEASCQRALRLRSLLGQRLQEAGMVSSYAAYERAGLELPDDAELWLDSTSVLIDEATHHAIPGALPARSTALGEHEPPHRDEDQATTIHDPRPGRPISASTLIGAAHVVGAPQAMPPLPIPAVPTPALPIPALSMAPGPAVPGPASTTPSVIVEPFADSTRKTVENSAQTTSSRLSTLLGKEESTPLLKERPRLAASSLFAPPSQSRGHFGLAAAAGGTLMLVFLLVVMRRPSADRPQTVKTDSPPAAQQPPPIVPTVAPVAPLPTAEPAIALPPAPIAKPLAKMSKPAAASLAPRNTQTSEKQKPSAADSSNELDRLFEQRQ